MYIYIYTLLHIYSNLDDIQISKIRKPEVHHILSQLYDFHIPWKSENAEDEDVGFALMFFLCWKNWRGVSVCFESFHELLIIHISWCTSHITLENDSNLQWIHLYHSQFNPLLTPHRMNSIVSPEAFRGARHFNAGRRTCIPWRSAGQRQRLGPRCHLRGWSWENSGCVPQAVAICDGEHEISKTS